MLSKLPVHVVLGTMNTLAEIDPLRQREART